jgi:hypothetical protein
MHPILATAGYEFSGIWFPVLGALVFAATVVFISIQLWMENPRRKEFNAAWYAQFEQHLRACYSSGEISWRANDMKSHFDHSIH